MTSRELKALEHRLNHFLEDLLAAMGRSERHHWARVYLQGLLLDGDRKSIEPMAQRIPGADVQALRQFVGQSPWAVDKVQKYLAEKVVDLLSDPEAWILDETSFPKAGDHSVGVARQYCGALGKIANCQVAVSLHWSSPERSCPLGWRLYLPKDWLEDPARLAEVKVPKDTAYRSKTELGLELIDQMLEWEVPQLPIVADSFYGNDFGFRQELRKRQLSYVVEVEPKTVAWTEDPNVALPPPKKTGRPRRYPPLDALATPKDLQTITQELPESAWHAVTWRQGSRGPMQSRFAKAPIWAAHGWREQAHPQRMCEHLVVEWPKEQEQPTKYWLAYFGKESVPGLRRLVSLAHCRWRIEQDYRELKQELGLDHYEGRQWLGWHHHVTLVSIAFAFLRAEQARVKKNFWCDIATDPEDPTKTTDPTKRPLPVV
jgi:SRSO17 transposase